MAKVKKRFLSTMMVLLMILSLTIANSVTALAADNSHDHTTVFYNEQVQNDDNQHNDYNFGPNAYAEAEEAVANHEADSIEAYLFEQFKLWYRSDPAFCAAIALHFDETGASGDTKLLEAYSTQPVDVRAAFATKAFIANPDDWEACASAIDNLLADVNPTIEELYQYTSAMYMVPNGLDGQYPLVVKRNSQNTGGHALKLELNGVTVLLRMECHGQPVGLTYWEEIVVPGTNKVVDDQCVAEPEPDPTDVVDDPEPPVIVPDPDVPIIEPDPIDPPVPPIVDPDPVKPPVPPIVDPDPVTPPVEPDPEPEPEPEPDYTVYLLSDIANETETVYYVTDDGNIVFDPNYDYGTYRTSLTVTPNDGENTGVVMVTTYTMRDTKITNDGTMTTDGYEYLQDDDGNKYLVSEHTADVIRTGLKSLSFVDVDEYIDYTVTTSSKPANEEPTSTGEEPVLAAAMAEPIAEAEQPVSNEEPVAEEPAAEEPVAEEPVVANDTLATDTSDQDAEPTTGAVIDDVVAPEEPKTEPAPVEAPANVVSDVNDSPVTDTVDEEPAE